MADERKHLILAKAVTQDMLAYPTLIGDQIAAFILELDANPFSPSILKESVDNHDGSFYHQLPSGCFVFWEILMPDALLAFLDLDQVMVRVTGARFDRAK